MPDNARKAFEELQALGISVYDWGEEEGYSKHVAFVLIWANDDGSEVYADIDQRYVKEIVVDGKIINPNGIRQDVHEVLKKYNLVSDWHSGGQLCIYKDSDALGMKHAADYNNYYPYKK